MNKWKILIADSHAIVRVGLLELASESFIVEEPIQTSSLDETLLAVKQNSDLNLVILGSNLGQLDELIGDIREFSPKVRILVFAKNLHYPHAISYLIAGANGFLTQNASAEEIVGAITKVLNNERYLCLELLEAMAQETFLNNVHRRKISPHKNKTDTPNSLNDKLSKRQKEIVDYLIKGESVSAIASHLNIKISTVGTHKSIVFEKLGVKNVLELIEMYYGDLVM
ncbi:LuxR C-terminal-related transcriptional regulator [Dyadobacter subterraneus]|uniref:Response regulator transcription factor n=1 Tax=Dyadobacter subterraneus TaxID=2773304 RepID=A0ABR9WI41_9BACT|nr:response regulator transcription factor [Dyadobacter subterraneus]MBE9465192.1 response regulator transcription factor [Dyadobacter subterraneus]